MIEHFIALFVEQFLYGANFVVSKQNSSLDALARKCCRFCFASKWCVCTESQVTFMMRDMESSLVALAKSINAFEYHVVFDLI